jgi:hypothetical protein
MGLHDTYNAPRKFLDRRGYGLPPGVSTVGADLDECGH